MESVEYDRMAQLEDTNWWFVTRRDLVWRLAGPAPTGARCLDVGCGTGGLLAEAMARYPFVAGLDSAPRALRFAKGRDLRRLILGDGTRLPFASDAFDVVVATEFFEHVREDERALAEAFRVLRPGGALVLTVPADPKLWSPHDVALHHFRRYRRRELRAKVEAAGFEVERLSFALAGLYPGVFAVRRLRMKRKRPATDLRPLPAPLNALLKRLALWENAWLARHNLPFGVSLVGRARKAYSAASTKPS